MKTDDKFNFFQNQLWERHFFVCLLQKQRNSAIADARAQYTPVQLVSFLTVVTPKKDKKEKQNKTTAVDARELNCGSLTSTYATHWARRNLADLMRIQLPHKVPGFMAHLGFQAQNVSTQLLFFEGGLRTTQLELVCDLVPEQAGAAARVFMRNSPPPYYCKLLCYCNQCWLVPYEDH